jgi:hypothetical protein
VCVVVLGCVWRCERAGGPNAKSAATNKKSCVVVFVKRQNRVVIASSLIVLYSVENTFPRLPSYLNRERERESLQSKRYTICVKK